ncbi:hypothetical protein GOBAR_DD10275 [Gossypium barbadense]|nr:hypothetical protein GOBAR_DD10275 [Gossypium barbadense]
MDKLISSWYKDQSLPESLQIPFNVRPGKLLVPRCNTVPVIYFKTSDYHLGKIHLWHDVLRYPHHSLEDYIEFWCQMSPREVVATYQIEAKKLGLRILELLCEGIGIEHGYFEHELTKDLQLGANHYPPIPEPRHISGLQVLKDGERICVEPIPNAFVVNIGYQLHVYIYVCVCICGLFTGS